MQYCPYCQQLTNMTEHTYQTTDILSYRDKIITEVICDNCHQTAVITYRFVTTPKNIQNLREEGML